MKLLDLVAINLDSWPCYKTCKNLRQNSNGILFYVDRNGVVHFPNINLDRIAEDCLTTSVTYDEWVKARRIRTRTNNWE